MSEIAACTLIQEEPDRKTERYMMMFKDYPDVVSVDILQEMLGICRKNAYLLVKQNKIHSARVGRSYKIPKLCVVEYLIDHHRRLGSHRRWQNDLWRFGQQSFQPSFGGSLLPLG